MIESDLPVETQKEVLKEAIQEWMDRQFALVGKWTVGALAVFLVGGMASWVVIHSRVGQ